MNERRVSLRHRTLKAGTISFSHGAGIDCVVRNLSNSGANLEVESQVGIPEAFDLMVKGENAIRSCRVIWRVARRIGVQFV